MYSTATTSMTSQAASDQLISKFAKRPKRRHPTAMGRILAARLFPGPTNWWMGWGNAFVALSYGASCTICKNALNVIYEFSYV